MKIIIGCLNITELPITWAVIRIVLKSSSCIGSLISRELSQNLVIVSRKHK